MTSPRRPSPDDQLAPDNYRQLNRTFYTAKPADYFDQRLENLILTAGRSEDLDRLMTEGVTYRGLKVGGHVEGAKTVQTDGRSPEDKAKAAEHFVIAEAEVLSHHVGETLLRLYLAHEFPAGQAPPCPWLEISRLRSFSQFKDIVRRRFGPDSDPDDPTNRAALARVFYLTDDPTKLADTPIPPDLWKMSLANIEDYLRGFAGQFLDRAALYNAAKHGLALLPSEMSMRLDDGSVIRADGPIIQYLKVREADGRPRWSQVNHWVKPDRQMALVFRACQLIDALWDVARIRYLPDQRPERFEVHLFGGARWHDLLLSDAQDTGGIVIEEMSFDLLYYLTAEEMAAEAASEVQDRAEPGSLGPDTTLETEGDDPTEE